MSRLPTRFAARAGAAGFAVLLTGAALAGCQSAAPADAPADDTASGYLTDGVFTVATGEPAYYPYVIDDAPESGEGFESAVAYAVAEQLGFDAADVVWVRTGFDEAIAPGPKDFDVNIQQFSITDERAEVVDFSSPYYSTPQAVITVEGSAAAGATSLADLDGLLVGADASTTSFQAIEQQIPGATAQGFNSNDDAKLALESGQVDALVVDLPTAFYLTGVELDGGAIVGQLPASAGIGDEWGLLLANDSPLTADVTAAVDALAADGTLDDIAAQWLGADAGAPVLQ
jgi:polar amino acid transport system substrate-binding protein